MTTHTSVLAGTVKRFYATFRPTVFAVSAAGVVTSTNPTVGDPTTVTLTVTVANTAGVIASTTTYTYALGEITRAAAGVYYKNITLSTEGVTTLLWGGDGAVPAFTSVTVVSP